MEYDRGDSFPFDFKPNGIPFGSKMEQFSNRKLSPRSYLIQCERKWKYSFLSVYGKAGFKSLIILRISTSECFSVSHSDYRNKNLTGFIKERVFYLYFIMGKKSHVLWESLWISLGIEMKI